MELWIEIMPRPFKRQRGVYKIVLHDPFIFLRDDLDPVMESIVLSHELGHDRLHWDEAERSGGFREFNIFASQLMLPDDEVMEHIGNGFDIQQIAAAMGSTLWR